MPKWMGNSVTPTQTRMPAAVRAARMRKKQFRPLGETDLFLVSFPRNLTWFLVSLLFVYLIMEPVTYFYE